MTFTRNAVKANFKVENVKLRSQCHSVNFVKSLPNKWWSAHRPTGSIRVTRNSELQQSSTKRDNQCKQVYHQEFVERWIQPRQVWPRPTLKTIQLVSVEILPRCVLTFNNVFRPIANKGHTTCVVCGEMAHHACIQCVGPDDKKGVAMHVKQSEKHSANKTPIACFFHHHNTSFFGSAKNEHMLLGKRKRDYSFPTAAEMEAHRQETKKITEPDVLPLSRASLPPAAPVATRLQVHTPPQTDPHDTQCRNGKT